MDVKMVLGQCRCSRVTEEVDERGFGSMQVAWSDRRGGRKWFWVNAGVLE